MANIQQIKQVQILSQLHWLHKVFGDAEEIVSPIFSIKILDLEWRSQRRLLLLFHNDNTPASSLILMPYMTTFRLDLSQNNLEINAQTRFFVASTPEEPTNEDYLLITYIG